MILRRSLLTEADVERRQRQRAAAVGGPDEAFRAAVAHARAGDHQAVIDAVRPHWADLSPDQQNHIGRSARARYDQLAAKHDQDGHLSDQELTDLHRSAGFMTQKHLPDFEPDPIDNIGRRYFSNKNDTRRLRVERWTMGDEHGMHLTHVQRLPPAALPGTLGMWMSGHRPLPPHFKSHNPEPDLHAQQTRHWSPRLGHKPHEVLHHFHNGNRVDDRGERMPERPRRGPGLREQQDSLLEFSVHSDKKLAFYGGVYNRDQRRDILKKWKVIPTSEGTKERGFGLPHSGRRIRLIPRGSGELITKSKAPPAAGRERRRSPYRRAARKTASYIGSDVDLSRAALLLDEG